MAKQPKILVVHGPNLNMLGKREPEIYGTVTLDEVNAALNIQAQNLGLDLEYFQSNHEGAIIDKIHEVFNRCDGFIINPGGLTHTSVALRDAVVILQCPKIEVHISNIHKREPFRHKSLLADIVDARIEGFGTHGYFLALDGLASMLHT